MVSVKEKICQKHPYNTTENWIEDLRLVYFRMNAVFDFTKFSPLP